MDVFVVSIPKLMNKKERVIFEFEMDLKKFVGVLI